MENRHEEHARRVRMIDYEVITRDLRDSNLLKEKLNQIAGLCINFLMQMKPGEYAPRFRN